MVKTLMHKNVPVASLKITPDGILEDVVKVINTELLPENNENVKRSLQRWLMLRQISRSRKDISPLRDFYGFKMFISKNMRSLYDCYWLKSESETWEEINAFENWDYQTEDDKLNEMENLQKCCEHFKIPDWKPFINQMMEYDRLCKNSERELSDIRILRDADTLDIIRFDKLFSSVEEAEVLYGNIRNFKKKMDELLDAASYIMEVDTLTDKINVLVDNAPYLPGNLKLYNNKYLSQIAADCLQELPNYPKLASYEFLYNFVESCLYSFNKEQLQALVSKKIIKGITIDKIALNGTEKYEENLQYLCFLTGHKEIVTNSSR